MTFQIGQKQHHLTVVSVSEDGFWITCECDCGNTKAFTKAAMLRGAKSCGCYTSRHGSKTIPKTHGLSKIPEYSIWKAMRSRCNDPKNRHYGNYGGRGIFVCPEWDSSFENFIGDIGFRPGSDYTLDRVDNNDGYYKENCRWVSRSDQQNNRRNTIFVELNGEKHCLVEWSEILGIPVKTLKARYHRGKPPEEILKTEVKVNKVLTIKHNGKEQTIRQWSEELGIPVHIIACRNRRGWPSEKIFDYQQ